MLSAVIGKGVGQLPMNRTCSLRGHPAIWLQNWLAANHATGCAELLAEELAPGASCIIRCTPGFVQNQSGSYSFTCRDGNLTSPEPVCTPCGHGMFQPNGSNECIWCPANRAGSSTRANMYVHNATDCLCDMGHQPRLALNRAKNGHPLYNISCGECTKAHYKVRPDPMARVNSSGSESLTQHIHFHTRVRFCFEVANVKLYVSIMARANCVSKYYVLT